MWLFTTLGFFSCTVSKDEPEMMQIRARERGDLDGLINTLGVPAEILETRNADYRWRIIVTPETFQTIVVELAKRVDYSNFKDAVHDTPGQENKGGPYLRVWSAMAGLQGGSGAAWVDVKDVEEFQSWGPIKGGDEALAEDPERAARIARTGNLFAGKPDVSEALNNPKAKRAKKGGK